MGRGFLGGIIWGLVAIFVAALGLSQFGSQTVVLAPPVAEVGGVPEQMPVEPGGSEDGAEATDLSAGDTPVETVETSVLQDPIAPEAAPDADRAVVSAPQIEDVDTLAQSPDSESETPDIVAETDGVEIGDAIRPAVPAAETAPSAPAADTSEPEVTNAAPQPAPVEAEAAGAPATRAEPIQTSDGAAAPLVPQADDAPVVDFSNPEVVATPAESTLPENSDAQADAAETADAPASAPAPEDDAPATASRVEVSRLTTDNEDTAVVADTEAPDGAEEAAFPPGTPALFRFAREFENPDGKPLMAIVLISDARGALNTSAEPMPFPVTYAVDGSSFAAKGLMQKARAQDQEVVALAPIDPAAEATDVVTSFEVYLNRVDEAVALMDEPVGNFQASRDVANAVVTYADLDGHGIVTYPRGLNSGVQVAEREGVPVALVFREFDNAGQDRAAMKRFLDQAAFRAGQQSSVILVGHDRPETIAALLEWRLSTRAEAIALAPVSALLRGQ